MHELEMMVDYKLYVKKCYKKELCSDLRDPHAIYLSRVCFKCGGDGDGAGRDGIHI